MFQKTETSHLTKSELYESLVSQLEHLLDSNEPLITLFANAAALLYTSLERINWAGFYLFDGAKLILGPFGGLPACTTIELNKGVCGAAASSKKTIIVPDVDQFPGHIACDSASRSEIVVPLVSKNGKLLGVLDIDSPELSRFDEKDQAGLEAISHVVIKKIEKHQQTSLEEPLFY